MSPSIAFISTESGTGSGVLIDGGFVVTNAHVVWPYNTVRVVFPDGSELIDVPVHNWDLLADLAILGPVNVDAAPLELVVDGPGAIGAEIYLVGYPGEVDSFPQPTITRGLISRLREWESIGATYFQVDAPIAGGQSGGALVSSRGDVIGISGFAFTEADFGLAASSGFVLPRINRLVAGQDPSGLGQRRPLGAAGPDRHVMNLNNWWDERAFVINEPLGTVVDVEVTGDIDLGFAIYDAFGTELLYVDESETGSTSGTVTIEYAEPHFLVVWQLLDDSGQLVVKSSHSLIPVLDPDDGRSASIGQSIYGNVDYPSDSDYFFLNLVEGELVEVVATSILIDTFAMIDFDGATDDQTIIDDDSGGGFFGLDSQIVYRAPHTGTFVVIIGDPDYAAPGGYALTVETAEQGASPTTTVYDSLFDNVAVDEAANSSSQFGPDELRSSFDGLPKGFEELDPAAEGMTPVELGIDDYFVDSVLFAQSEPFEIILALSGQVTDLERIRLDADLLSPERFLSDFRQSLIEAQVLLSQDDMIDSSGSLSLVTVGEISVGAWSDLVLDGVQMRGDTVLFRRGNLVGLVYSFYFPDSDPAVGIEKVSQLLDAAFIDFLKED